MKFRRKAVPIEAAVQWFKLGDHDKVEKYCPLKETKPTCRYCGMHISEHGWCDLVKPLEGGHIVCPGDWIITELYGTTKAYYPCKNDIFLETYEKETE
jgi:hypothetical protein